MNVHDFLIGINDLLGQPDRLRLEADWDALVRRVLDLSRVRSGIIFSSGGTTRFAFCATAESSGISSSGNEWQIYESAVELSEHPMFLKAFATQQPTDVTIAGSEHIYVFPLVRGQNVDRLVEVTAAAKLTDTQYQLMKDQLALLGSIFDMLDYGEKDSLTGLFNRKSFDETLLRFINDTRPQGDALEPSAHAPARRQLRPGMQHWLAVLDIDHFKRVNDVHGHLIGDEILLLVGQLMKNNFRMQDKLFRFGGEEFVVMLHSVAADDVDNVLERFRACVENTSFPRVGSITVSIGYAPMQADQAVTTVIDHADEALYYIKRNGRNAVGNYQRLLKENKIKVEHGEGEIELF